MTDTEAAVDSTGQLNALNLDFNYAYGKPQWRAGFRTEPEDFLVYEDLPEPPQGSGEHIYLYIQKRNNNTAWIAKQLAGIAGVQNMDVSYAGMKDRRAVTEQWFSIYFPKGDEPKWDELELEGCRILKVSRGASKLRRGAHLHNRFEIRLRNVSGDRDSLEQRLKQTVNGVPNYFGEQRFGIEGQNLVRAQLWYEQGVRIKNRQQKKFIVSASRSYLFNLVLSRRIELENWQSKIAGDVLQGPVSITGSASDLTDPNLNEDEQAADTIPADGSVPTGPLWGRGRLDTSDAALDLENEVLQDWSKWQHELEHQGLRQDRRALNLLPQAYSWQWEDDDLVIKLTLPPGTYATAVLREICQLEQPVDEKI